MNRKKGRKLKENERQSGIKMQGVVTVRITTHEKKQYRVADKTTNQHLRRIYSADKKTAAHKLLNLSIAVILANYYTAMELMADQSLLHLFKLLQEKSIEELDTTCASLQLSDSAG